MYGARLASPHIRGGLLARATRQILPSLTSTARKLFNMPMSENNVLGKNYLPSRTYSFFSWREIEPCTAEVQNTISYYQTNGHRFARLNPLQISEGVQPKPPLNEHNLDTVYTLPESTKIGGDELALPLREIVRRLESTYCSSIGVEYMHIHDQKRCDWIKGKFEPPCVFQMTPEEKRALLQRLTHTTGVSVALRSKWPIEKGYSLEGCDILIPALQEIIDQSSKREVNSYIIGMPRRGRVNVLAEVFQKPLKKVFGKFYKDPNDEGDMVYHLGTYSAIQNEASKRDIQLSLVANPSHAESVDPVVLGKTRAIQFLRKDSEGKTAMSILVHGEAAFSGQGVVYETFHLSTLPDYTTHGTVHFIVNNQIHPQVARSSLNCTDVAKIVAAPIFHVNADDPEAVIHVCRVAAEWRETFKSDVIIDLVGYRHFGHPEVDELAVTWPAMNNRINSHDKVVDIYSAKLMDSGIVIKEDYERDRDEYYRMCNDTAQNSKGMATSKLDWLDSPQKDLPSSTGHIPSTGITESKIHHVAAVYCTIPNNIKPHSGIEGAFQKRLNMLREKSECDWAMGEALAFGSLLEKGIHVRLSGQHVKTGIYSRRHHVIHDQEMEDEQYSPLCNISPNQAQYSVCNSSLSEFAVLGFELGFSMSNPHSLVCWEAQFGDFHNTAQCIIDQYIASGEEKWARPQGLVLLLSHGYEGMGPEHSSARLERFLQLCADDADCQPNIDNSTFEYDQLYACNMQVINCTTPANYFHALRRQVKMPFKKPLIVMTLKNPWEYPSSHISDMTEGTNFIRLIPDTTVPEGGGVRRVVFCSGKVYYELVKQREMEDLTDSVAISRLEQISPFPYDLVARELSRFPAADIVWSQEEPKNMGAWSYVQPRFLTATGNRRDIRYAGRPPSAAVATGSKAVHQKEQDILVNMAFEV